MPTTPKYRVIVHPTTKGWTWTQVARNGSAGAVAPTTFDNKANAKRAGQRQVAALNADTPAFDVPKAALVVDETYRRNL